MGPLQTISRYLWLLHCLSAGHSSARLWTDTQIGGHLPTLLEATQARDGSIQYTPNADDVPVIDSETWIPELSSNGFVGIFHHHHVGATGDSMHCLYIACQSHLPAACLDLAVFLCAEPWPVHGI